MSDVFFGPDATLLHGVLTLGESPESPAVIILHPHPQFGGNMNNNVVLGVEQACAQAGFTTLRFNFRGTGRSRGAFDNGAGEQDDVRYAIDLLEKHPAAGPIAIVGYSFGAAVGLPVAAQDSRIPAFAGIAPPTIMADFSFLSDCPKPMLIIAGTHDDYCDHAKVKSLLDKPTQTFNLLSGVDHFYVGVEYNTGTIIADFLCSTSCFHT